MTPIMSLSKTAVETQLARVIGSRQFCNAPRLSRFLTYVVEEDLAGRPERLKGYTIGLEVFDRPEDFDPQTDTIVRVQARALRQKLDQYYAQDGCRDPIHISIAKGSYEPSFALAADAALPISADDAPAGVSSDKPSIAVLPFDDFSIGPDNGHFAHGITEETIANLSRFRKLTVFSRWTMEKLKSEKQRPAQIREILGADFVLEGSVRIDADRVDVSINLVDALTGEIVLTAQFSSPTIPSALYQAQDDIATQIAARITDQFGPLGQYAARATRLGHSQKWESYYWISRYHQYSLQMDRAERREIRTGLAKALDRDPGSSDAHALMALLAADDFATSMDSHDDNQTLADALTNARLAVSLDSQNAIAYEALAVTSFHRGELAEFDRAAHQALRLNPGHGVMLARLGICFGALANWAEAMPLLNKAIRLNPLYPGWYRVIRAIGLAMTKDPQQALTEIRAVPVPDFAFYHAHLIWMLVDTGQMDEANREKVLILQRWPDFESGIPKHLRAWQLDASISTRALAGWRKVGLCA
ncbi:MAG: hypothetical protein WAT09_02570 [Paracoccaceae bacterium]